VHLLIQADVPADNGGRAEVRARIEETEEQCEAVAGRGVGIDHERNAQEPGPRQGAALARTRPHAFALACRLAMY